MSQAWKRHKSKGRLKEQQKKRSRSKPYDGTSNTFRREQLTKGQQLAYIIHKPGILTRLSPRTFFRSGTAETEAIEQLAARTPTSIIGREGRLSAKEIDELYNSFNSQRAKLASGPAGSAASAKPHPLTPEELKTREWEKFVFEPANPQTYVRPVNRPPNTGGFEFEDWELGLPLD
jgi:hypothetical protein